VKGPVVLEGLSFVEVSNFTIVLIIINPFVVFVGVALSGYWISRTMNTVRRVVLRKGGKYVTIVTYGILGFSSRYTTKAVSQV
jgi:hypothetical protein